MSRAAVALLLAASILSCAGGSSRSDGARTVILISIDTLRADALSCYGNPRPTTPNLDRLAEEGVRFAQAEAPAPWTIPSHVALLTSLPPTVIGADGRHPVPPETVTLPEHLRTNGFATGAVVNTLFLSEKYGFEQGFDEFSFMKPRKDAPENVDRALEFLAAHRGAPQFLFLHLFDVHAPYVPPAPYDRLYVDVPYDPDGAIAFLRRVHYHDHLGQLESAPSVAWLRAKYDAGLTRVDRELGRLFDGVRELGLWNDALVIVTADHGEAFFERGVWVGHGLFLHPEELHIPLIVKPPASYRLSGVVADLPVDLLDVAPTITDAAGVPALPAAQGQSLFRLLRGGDGDRPMFSVSSSTGDSRSVRVGRFHYIEPMQDPLPLVLRRHLRPDPDAAVLLQERIATGPQLFDLEQDPGERTNLAPADPGRVAAMQRLLDDRRAADLRLRAELLGLAPPDVELSAEEETRLRSLGYAQ